MLDEHDLKLFIEGTKVVPLDANPLKEYKKNIAKERYLILDGVRDHVVCHIASKATARDMWQALETLYQGSSE